MRRRDCHEESRLLIGRCRNVDLCLATDGLQSLRTGTEKDCLAAFLKREQESGRNLPKEHWLDNNSEVRKRFAEPSYERYRLEVFQSGQRLDRASLTAEVKNRLR